MEERVEESSRGLGIIEIAVDMRRRLIDALVNGIVTMIFATFLFRPLPLHAVIKLIVKMQNSPENAIGDCS